MAELNTAEFPQADKLEQVGRTVVAVSQGKHQDVEIEKFLHLHSRGRQGRYYRKAAETLGLLENRRNNSTLTPRGAEFAATCPDPASQTEFLARCIIEAPIFKNALRYIGDERPTEEQLKKWFYNNYHGNSHTAGRRFSTFRNYILETGLVSFEGNRARLGRFREGLLLSTLPEPPDLPAPGIEGSFHSNLPGMPEAKTNGPRDYEVDSELIEWANLAHWKLVISKSSYLRTEKKAGTSNNKHIDLFAERGEDHIIYEMKSVDPQGTNLEAQVRKAVSQLYEYRYRYHKPNAFLCIVTNYKMPEGHWLADYLANDRHIAYEWTEDFETFSCDACSGKLLGPFSPG
jgi:hypothetical protein